MEKNNYRIFGIRTVIEAIEAGKVVDKIFVQKGLQGNLIQDLLALAKRHHISLSYVPVEKLYRLSKKNHQGVVANLSPIDYADMETLIQEVVASKEKPLFLLLDHLSDVRNFGAIIRTAACVGVDGIIVPKQGAAPVTADTVKTSAGAVFQIPITKVDHLKDAIYYLQASGVKVLAASEKAQQTVYEEDLNMPLALVMGAEDVGVSKGVLKVADVNAKLPLTGGVDSLNVSVACGAILYETYRQRI
ncbi:MAG: 23S rRNA (guanosine(2251)-2'-O)-methyltransferase RlmB [Flavobacteriaceae bacterium]|nr:23S rRNA (guanosine(2251)-2'-O)-methyltransferase RlmB [Flavobacteriaceae bacterium]